MVRIGIIGIGFMGMIHYYGAKKVSGGEVVAICTRDQNKLDGDWTEYSGEFRSPRWYRRSLAPSEVQSDRGTSRRP